MHNLYSNFLVYKSLFALALLLRPSTVAVSLIKALHNDSTNCGKQWRGGCGRYGKGSQWQQLASPGEPHINYKRLKVKAATITAFLHYSVSRRQHSVSFPLPLSPLLTCHLQHVAAVTLIAGTQKVAAHTHTQRQNEGCWATLKTRKEKQKTKTKNIKKKRKHKRKRERGQRGNGKTFILFISAGNCETRINLIKYSLARSANACGHSWPRQRG